MVDRRTRIRRAACIAALTAAAGCGDSPTDARPEPPLDRRALEAGLAPLPAEPVRPPENPYGPEKVALGRLLFFDPILSGPRDVACSTCHLPRFAFTDRRRFSVGAGGTGLGPERTEPEPPLRPMPRNTPTVLNVGLFGRMGPEPSSNATMFWGGNAFGLEDQALNPISADKELRGLTYAKTAALDSVVARLRANDEYVERFSAAFAHLAPGDDPAAVVTPTTLRRALAAYMRELTLPRTPLDAFLEGNRDALTDSQKAGLELFIGDAGCVACHGGPLLSDFRMHVLGAPQTGIGRDTTPRDDLGWGEVGGTPYAFRTPPLRQVALTAPYLHAGTAETLMDVLRFKDRGRSEHANVAAGDLDPLFRPLGLTEDEMRNLVSFLRALSDTVTVDDPLFLAPDAVPSGLTVPR